MIEIKNLRKAYPNVTPLKDVSVTINDGDVISIIGPSGTGKSTLLRCVNLLETPTSGQIIVDGEDITDKKCDICRVRRKMGMVFQSFNLFEHKNIIENIMFAPVKLLGRTRQEAYDRGMELLETVGLAQKALNFPNELSGGQKQRVAIARTLAMDPEIILFDEPTSALDPTMVGEVLSVIRTLAKQNITMMIVTHEMKFARDVSNRVFYMDEGGIYEDGSPAQIFDDPIKEKTRRFVRRLKVFEAEITSKQHDFIALLNDAENFASKHFMPKSKFNGFCTIFDELVMQTIIPKSEEGFKITLSLEYSEEKDAADMTVSYSGRQYNALDECDELSAALIKNVCQSVAYETSEDKNILKISMK